MEKSRGESDSSSSSLLSKKCCVSSPKPAISGSSFLLSAVRRFPVAGIASPLVYTTTRICLARRKEKWTDTEKCTPSFPNISDAEKLPDADCEEPGKRDTQKQTDAVRSSESSRP